MSDENAPTLTELRDRAKELDVDGRTKMDAEQLTAAIAEAEALTGPGSVRAGADVRTDQEAAVGAGQLEHPVELLPGTPDEVGLPNLLDVATDAADNRETIVINRPEGELAQ